MVVAALQNEINVSSFYGSKYRDGKAVMHVGIIHVMCSSITQVIIAGKNLSILYLHVYFLPPVSLN